MEKGQQEIMLCFSHNLHVLIPAVPVQAWTVVGWNSANAFQGSRTGIQIGI